METSLYEQYRRCPVCESPFNYPFQREAFFDHVGKCVASQSDQQIYAMCDREGIAID